MMQMLCTLWKQRCALPTQYNVDTLVILKSTYPLIFIDWRIFFKHISTNCIMHLEVCAVWIPRSGSNQPYLSLPVYISQYQLRSDQNNMTIKRVYKFVSALRNDFLNVSPCWNIWYVNFRYSISNYYTSVECPGALTYNSSFCLLRHSTAVVM